MAERGSRELTSSCPAQFEEREHRKRAKGNIFQIAKREQIGSGVLNPRTLLSQPVAAAGFLEAAGISMN